MQQQEQVTGYFLSPDGNRILGTLDRLYAVANVAAVVRSPDGVYELDWTGTTDVFWDGQTIETLDGERLYVCTQGREWKESELTFVEGDA